MYSTKFIPLLTGLLSLTNLVTSHMDVVSPPPRRSKYNKNYPESSYDYSYTSPLGPEFPFPCRGYGKGPSSGDIQAGQSVKVTLGGEAPHNGGHCQFAVSYNDKDFVVLKTVMGTCMLDSMSYDVPIPADAPNGPITLVWGWINRTGNREYYMNCIDMNIKGGKQGGSITGKSLFVANLPGYETFPEGFANDYGQSKIDGMPTITITPNGSANPQPNPSPSPTPSPTPSPQPTQPSYPTQVPPETKPTTSSETKPTTSSETKPTLTQVPTYTTEPSYPTGAPPTQSKPTNVPTTTTSNPSYPTEVPNKPVPSKPTKCETGELKCGPNGLEMCAFDVFYQIGCPGNTTCQVKNGKATCDFKY